MKRYIQTLWDRAEKNNENNIFCLLEYNPNAILLDCGCGEGKNTLKFASRIGTQDIFGIEIAKELIDKAKEKRINVKEANLNSRFPFEDEGVDVLTANQVIEHLYDTDNFISEIYRVLRIGGYAIISTENLSSWHNIFALLFGWQPFSITNILKDKLGIGNPLALHRNEVASFSSLLHTRVFAYQALKEFFEIKGFVVERILGAGYYPLPNFLAKVDPRHSAFLTIKARKIE